MAVEGLEEQLRSCSEEELAGMCQRLVRSQENLKELHAQLQEDQLQLKEENKKLQEDITLMISCTKPLCIGANNTKTPELEEGSLDFVGRWWEQMKPRTNGVQVNEHLGEIKKTPTAIDSEGKKLDERSEVLGAIKDTWGSLKSSGLWQQGQALATTGIQKATETARESGAIEASQGAWASLRQTAGSTWATAGQTWAQLNAEKEKPTRSKKSRSRREKQDRGGYAKQSDDACSKAASSNGHDGNGASVSASDIQEASASQSSASASGADPLGADDAASPADNLAPEPQSEAFEDAPSAERHSVKGEPVEATSPDVDSAPEEDEDALEDQMSSTVLIEAHLTLGDGSVQTIRVRAADRCKEVAQRFVKEHSLKNLFVQPLTDYLKQVENDAEKFPVSVHADLMQIYGGA